MPIRSQASDVAVGMTVVVCWIVQQFGPDWNPSTTIGWIALNLGTDIHSLLWINSTHIGNPNDDYDQIPATLMTFPPVSAVSIFSAN